ncbi:tryptophan-rich sensory protein [Terribacillus sp. 179-K 1B1 HS]|uniref:tryptophan-rich sensory protein n=1 Tax=Terribacillus sp. 179-K 1B1 HS TaxID=3142388 RepID=UPI0039A3A0BD
MSNRSVKLAWFSLLAYIAAIAVNYLSNALPLGGKTMQQLSDQLGVLFQPAGYAFSIWGIIYFFVLIWVIRLFLRSTRESEWYPKAAGAFIASCIFNIAWLFSFHYELFSISIIPMVALLISLIILYQTVSTSSDRRKFDLFPFSIYIGWVSVATILNVGILFVSLGVDNIEGWLLSGEVWTIILLIVGTILAIGFMHIFRDSIYPLVFVWAYFAIAAARAEDFPAITAVASIMAVIILIAIPIHLFRRKKGKQYGY